MTSALALALTLVQVPAANAFPAGYHYLLTPDPQRPGLYLAIDSPNGNPNLALNQAKRGVLTQQWSALLTSDTQIVKLRNRVTGQCMQEWNGRVSTGSCAAPNARWKQFYRGGQLAFGDTDNEHCIYAEHNTTPPTPNTYGNDCNSPRMWWRTAKA
jgi:hypothetical protein